MSDRRRPLGDRVLIKQDQAEKNETYQGSEEKPSSGEVIMVGNGKNGVPMEVKVGDRVKYARGAGIDIELDGIDYILVEEARILMIL